MLFPNRAFSEWILTISDDRLRKAVNSILKPLQEKNATYKAMKLCLEQLTLECKVQLERIPVQLIEKYRREKSERTCRLILCKQKLIDDRKKLRRLAHDTDVLKKKSKVSSVWGRRLNKLIRKNILQMNMVRMQLRSKCNSRENCDEKNDEIKNKKTMKITSSKAEIRKRLYVCNKSESLLSSDMKKRERVSLKTNMDTDTIKDTCQEEVCEKEMCSLIAKNYKNGVCQNSSQIVKQTVKVPHKEVLPIIVKNVHKKVPVIDPHNRQSHMKMTLGSKEACKRNDANSKNGVHIDRKILHSSSQHRSSGKKTLVDKSQDSKRVINKSDHTVKIVTESSKKFDGQHEKEKNATIYNEQRKNPEHSSSDRQSVNKTSLHVSKNRKITGHVQSEVENKVYKSHEHKSHHKGRHHEGRSDCKTKHDSHVMSHLSTKKPKSHEQNTASHEDGKSSSHVSKSHGTTKRLHQSSSSHNAERKCKTVSPKEMNHKSSGVLHTRSIPRSDKTKELVMANIHRSGISSELGNCQSKKRPYPAESGRRHGPVKSAKVSRSSNGTEKHYNLETANNSSVQQVPVLPSMPLLDDNVSPCENGNLNSGCVSNQSAVEQSVVQKKFSHGTVNTVSNQQSAIVNKQVQIPEATMLVDLAIDKSQNLSKQIGKCNEISHSINLCPPDKEDASNTVRNCSYFLDQNSSVVGKESDAGNASLSSEVAQSSSKNANSGTVDCSVQTEMQNTVKKEISASYECKLEDKNWFRNGTGDYSAHSDINSNKEPDVIIIDDDDDDDDIVFECSRQTVDPEIMVISHSFGGVSCKNEKTQRLDSIEAAIRQSHFYSIYNDDISLNGKIYSKIYEGNEYVFIENPDYEIAGIDSITGKKMAPLKIRNIIDYCKSTLKEPACLLMTSDKIIASGKDKTFISYIVFLCYSYDYFLLNISDEVRKLAEILHLKLQDMKMIKQLEINLNKLTENELKMKERERAQEFITANKKARATVFSELFVHIMEKYSGFRSLPPYYQALFSLILFQRIICKLYHIDCEYVNRYFLDIRFIIKELMSYENCNTSIIILLTGKSNIDFVNDFNIVARSIRVVQLAVKYKCSGSILNRNEQESKHLILLPNVSSSLHDAGEIDDNTEAFSQLPSVSSSQLQENSTTQNPLIPESNTLEAGSNRTTREHDSLQPCHAVSEIINKSPVLLHQLQRTVPAGRMVTDSHQNKTAFSSQPLPRIASPPRSNVIHNQQSDDQHLKRRQASISEAAYVNYNNIYHFPDIRGTLDSQNPLLNLQNLNNNLQNRVFGSQESIGQVNNRSFMSNNKLSASSLVCRPPLPPQVAHSGLRPPLPPPQVGHSGLRPPLPPHQVGHSGLNHATDRQMSGYILTPEQCKYNRVVYRSLEPTNMSSDSDAAEHNTSIMLHAQLPNPPGPNCFSAANKSSNPNFLQHSSSSGFQPSRREYSDVLQGNQNVYRRLQQGINNNNYGHSGGFYKKKQYESSLQRRRHHSQYNSSNCGSGQYEQRLPQLPQQPPVYYQNTTVMAVGGHGLLTLPCNNNNASNVNASRPNHITNSFFPNGSQPFTR